MNDAPTDYALIPPRTFLAVLQTKPYRRPVDQPRHARRADCRSRPPLPQIFFVGLTRRRTVQMAVAAGFTRHRIAFPRREKRARL
ncbi:hypothetical protein NEILACOT_03618 [Neisseria lactamica ATCC 23970]|uniref:Uncharacterized protein n=1 Tax=Neisseria lactamica ATCC 23970 TaxID=546265 RepID=D0W7W8_NEILA|nr:hypothetical protein NEILACOT_03618 [Neisseria lactamica ATCC 23970]